MTWKENKEEEGGDQRDVARRMATAINDRGCPLSEEVRYNKNFWGRLNEVYQLGGGWLLEEGDFVDNNFSFTYYPRERNTLALRAFQ